MQQKQEILSNNQQKILQYAIKPYKIKKDIRNLLNNLKNKQNVSIGVIPSSSHRYIKDTYNYITTIYVLLLMLYKLKYLNIALNHSKSSQKQIDQKSCQQLQCKLQENFKKYIQNNQYKQNQKLLSNIIIYLNDQPQTIYQLYSLKFLNNILQEIIDCQILLGQFKINQKIIQNKNNLIINRQNQIIKLSKNISKILYYCQLQCLQLKIQSPNIFLYQAIANNQLNYQKLIKLSISSKNIDSNYFLQFCKKLINLSTLDIDIIQFVPSTQKCLQQYFTNIVIKFNIYIQSIKFANLQIPDLKSQQFAKILWKCPYLGELIILHQNSSQKIRKILELIMRRRVSLQNYMQIIKVLDLGQNYDYSTCLQVLDYCKQFMF